MKKRQLLIVTCMAMSIFACSPDPSSLITFERADPLQKVLREMNFFPGFVDTVDVARGENATFQFVIRAGVPIKGLKATLSPMKQEGGGGQLTDNTVGFVEYAFVGNPTPNPAKDAIVSPSKYYPDPVHNYPQIDVVRDVAQPIWVDVKIPTDAKDGLYTGTFTVEGTVNGSPFKMSKDVNIKVYPVTINESSLWVTNWYSLSKRNLKIFNGGKDVPLYGDTYWELVEETAKKMAHCRQNVVIVPINSLTNYTLQDGKYTFDFGNFDRTVEIFKNAGVCKMIEGGHLGGRVGDWMSPFGLDVPTGHDAEGYVKFSRMPMERDSAQNYIKQFIPAMVSHLKDKGWWDSYTQHIADEPIGGASAKSYTEIANAVKAHVPEIQIIEACHSKDVANTINIWVPQLDFFESDHEFYRERQAKGDQVWFYTCLAPQGQSVNRFLEQPLIKTRLIHWLNYRFNATGYLHWGLFYWNTDDPYKQTTVMNAEGGNTLPGGDSWIVYPENGKLHGSMRLDAMRDGVADYELLRMLEKKNKAMADELCRLTVFNWKLYNVEGDHFRKTRRTILEELSK